MLARIEGLLRRWLQGVTTQLDAAVPPSPPATAPRPNTDPRRPAPPDHWVALVREHAPHLLDPVESAAADASEANDAAEIAERPADMPVAPRVIDYRAENSRNNPPPLLKPSHPRPIDVARASAAQRPLRLEAVSTRPMDAVEIAENPTDKHGEVAVPSVRNDIPMTESERVAEPPPSAALLEPEFVGTTTRSVEMADPIPPKNVTSQAAAAFSAPVKLNERIARLLSQVNLRRHAPADAPAQPIHAVAVQTETTQAVSAHFAPSFPTERQQIRETVTSIPSGANAATIHTRAGQAPRLHEERTHIPASPSVLAQTVLRPTLPALNLADVTPDRWPTLPDEPTESPRDPSVERQQRARLNREQEGGRWSE